MRALSEAKIISLGKKQMLAKKLLEYLYSQPITDMQATAKALEISIPTAARLLNDMVKLEILNEITGFKRNRIFTFEKYLDLFR